MVLLALLDVVFCVCPPSRPGLFTLRVDFTRGLEGKRTACACALRDVSLVGPVDVLPRRY